MKTKNQIDEIWREQIISRDNPTEAETDKEILKFGGGHIVDAQTGERLLSLFGPDVAGEWNCNDEWISGDQILFSPYGIQ
jgi:hypothetical protein